MPNDSDVSELLLRWQEARFSTKPLSVEDVCAAHPDLLAEVRRRIQALEAMERRLGLGTAPTDSDARPVAAPTVAEGPGNQVLAPAPEDLHIPGYDVLGLIDQGGMGSVYKARQVQLKRLVALKMIRGDVHARPEHLARFRVEAEAVAQLQHPNIVQIFDVGEAGGRPYFSMEFVEGGSLAQKIAGQPLPPRAAAELVATLADAIHFAHERGVVHRDLKPANVLIAAGGRKTVIQEAPSSPYQSSDGLRLLIADCTLKITDFGLAKRLNGEPGASALAGQTQSGMILGTPSYMAPEQAAGKPREIGPPADVYALGAILYEMLTGKPPFSGATSLDTLLQVMANDPMPPSRAQPRVPRDLENICLKCLEKSPARRYATAAALGDDLRRFLNGLPINARSISFSHRAVKWARRRPEATLLAAVLLLVLGWVGRAAWLHHRAERDAREMAAQLAPRARQILHQYCWSCHGEDSKHTEGHLDVLDHRMLLNDPRELVVPGNVPASHLIRRIEDNSMPPEQEEEFPRLASDELEVLKKWVEGGAPPFAPAGPDDFAAAHEPESKLAVEVKKAFQDKCYECHRLGNAKNGIKVLNYDLLVAKRKVVVPGNPSQSSLYQSLLSTDPKKVMPPPDALELSELEIDAIRRWIAEGAPAFPRTHRAKEKDKNASR
ncbi:MAG: protein kinase [Planctomycetia bacterium]|nr:protein kinase [Planctomycetia bacterium]